MAGCLVGWAGGSERFNLFTSELGDSVVGNGKIALLVFVRASSDIRPVVSGKGQVAHGVNLGVSRFHNKGGVGLAFQCCENTSIAFIATHFASDSGGRQAGRPWPPSSNTRGSGGVAGSDSCMLPLVPLLAVCMQGRSGWRSATR